MVPTAMRPPKEFRETIKIGSASSWDKNILSQFHVGFNRNDFGNIRDFIDEKYFRAPDHDVEYARRAFRVQALLNVGYTNIMNASGNTTKQDLSADRELLVSKYLSNPLGAVFELLANFLVMPSAESIDLTRSKSWDSSPRKGGSPRKKAKVGDAEIDEMDILQSLGPNSEREHVVAIDSTFTPQGSKRNFSGQSFGASSTETTPSKINRSEPFTQQLENTLCRELIRHLWLGGPKILWAENRKMYLDYVPYAFLLALLNIELLLPHFVAD